MRDIRPGRNVTLDARLESIFRVSQNPVTVQIEREVEGSTIDGPAPGAPMIACVVTGRVDRYAIMRRGASERHEEQGRGSEERYRLEIPFPTDQNGVTVDIHRGDHVTINSTEFRVVDIVFPEQGVGYVEGVMDKWL